MIVGYRVVTAVVGALAAGMTVFFLIRFIQDTGRTEQRLENLQDQIELREQIDNAISNTPTSVDSAIELLQQRQNP
jgi:hypothetical protein